MTDKAQWLGIAVINVLEFLGFEGLSATDRALFMELVSRATVVDLNCGNKVLMELVTDLRKTRAVKIPDAIVMASAALHNAAVITNDAVGLKLGATAPSYAAQAF